MVIVVLRVHGVIPVEDLGALGARRILLLHILLLKEGLHVTVEPHCQEHGRCQEDCKYDKKSTHDDSCSFYFRSAGAKGDCVWFVVSSIPTRGSRRASAVSKFASSR